MKGQISNSQELSPLIFQALDIYSHVFCFYFSPWTFSVAKGHGPRVFETAKTGFESSGPVGRNFLFQSFLLKDLWVPGWNFLFP